MSQYARCTCASCGKTKVKRHAPAFGTVAPASKWWLEAWAFRITCAVTAKSATQRLKELEEHCCFPTLNFLIYVKMEQSPSECKFHNRKVENLNY